jgi:amino acid transporter
MQIKSTTASNLQDKTTNEDEQSFGSHSSRSSKKKKALKLWPLAVLVFYNVSGGPFGIEPTIRAAGNFYAILGFAVFPFIWAIPEALVTAELGSAFLDASAGVAWVEEAFGPRMGGLCGYLGWISGATDNAIYPVRLNSFSFTNFVDLFLTICHRHCFWSTSQALRDGTKMNLEASTDLSQLHLSRLHWRFSITKVWR